MRRSISASSRAASSALTSVIGSRTSALSINPVRHSQYLIGAGLGSENNSRVRSATDRQRASAASRSPAVMQLVNLREGFGFDMRGRQDAAVGAVAQRLVVLRVLAGQNGEVLRAAAQQFERLVAVRAAILQADDIGMAGQRSIASLPRLTPVR